MPFYSFSSDLRDWKETHACQEEILDYWIQLTKKYDLYPHIELNNNVKSAAWDITAQHYNIVTENLLTGEQTSSIAHIVISAIGILDTPRFAKIPGLASFKGESFHSGRWDKSVQLAGKKVGVIGNGASA